MKIDRQNYEQYLIDYLDGKLDEEQTGSLTAFLELNPDLKEEFEGIEKMNLTPDEIIFQGKTSLFRSASELEESLLLKDFDMYCISSIENDITDEEEEKLKAIIRNDPDREATYRLYESTRLLPDESIQYPGKARLRKRFTGIPMRFLLPVAAAAAALLLMLQLFSDRGGESREMTDQRQVPADLKDDMGNRPPVAREDSHGHPAPMITGDKGSADARGEQQAQGIDKRSALAQAAGIRADSVAVIRKVRMETIAPISIQQLDEPASGHGGPVMAYRVPSRTSMTGDHQEPAGRSGPDSRLSLWILADAGVRGLNSVSEDEYLLEHERDKKGYIKRFTLDTPVFGISAPLHKHDKSR
jgi:hypothetical protein